MAEHYYTKNPTSEHHERDIAAQVFGMEFVFTTDSGVFSRDGVDPGTRVLIEALPEIEGRALDLGCGWGVIGVAIGKHWPDTVITMADINQRACDLSRKNAAAAGVEATVIESDGYEKVLGNTYDLILQNPPIRAGKAVIYKMFADASACLHADGELWLVIRKQQGAPSAITYLKTLFEDVDTVEKKSGFWIIRCRQPIKTTEDE